jgi:hypothetical protein
MARKKTTEPSPITINAIKGFEKDLKCRGFQFEIGKTYIHEGPVKACESGFHACPDDQHPLSVFEFYAPAGSRFFEVQMGGATDRQATKIAAASVTLSVELTVPDLVKRAWDYVWSRAKLEGEKATGARGAASATGYYGAASATGDYGAASATGARGAASATGDYGAASATGARGAASATGYYGAASATGDYGAASATGARGAASATGYYGAASATGDYGAASATGDYGAASATGYYGAASATGDYGAASATGDYGAASATGDYGAASATGAQGAASATGIRGAASVYGKYGHASATGPCGSVMGADLMQSLFAREFDDENQLVSIACGIVGKGGIKPGVWYYCKDGKLVEAKP